MDPVESIVKSAEEVDAVIDAEIFVPALLKSAVENGVPPPRSREEAVAIVNTAREIVRAKIAQMQAQGQYPELRQQFDDPNGFHYVENMAKRAADSLTGADEAPPVSANLIAATDKFTAAVAAARAAQSAAK